MAGGSTWTPLDGSSITYTGTMPAGRVLGCFYPPATQPAEAVGNILPTVLSTTSNSMHQHGAAFLRQQLLQRELPRPASPPEPRCDSVPALIPQIFQSRLHYSPLCHHTTVSMCL